MNAMQEWYLNFNLKKTFIFWRINPARIKYSNVKRIQAQIIMVYVETGIQSYKY